jgi:glycosyltransferase involved in cell wall biosynthesis
MASPLISVIMPLYNKRHFIKRAIESIQKQTFANWELIIVDDGSTDGSSEMIPKDDPRIKLFIQENKGPGAARNNGVKIASGDFITFLDADDYYYPFKLETEMNLLWKEQKAEWMMSAFEYEKSGRIEKKYIKDIEGNEIKGEPRIFDNALKQLLVAGWHINGLCIKKRLLEDVGGFNESMKCYEITELMIRCALKQPFVVIYNNALYRVVDVDNSAFKIYDNLIEGRRQMGESLYILSKDNPEYSDLLMSRSQNALYSYVAMLILKGEGYKARRYLIRNFMHKRDKKWCKMWIGSFLPIWLLKKILDTNNQNFN